MYAVVQFIENGKFQVLSVPATWIRGGTLLWPKLLSNEKVEQMRREGIQYHGSTKTIPVIVTKKCKNFKSAEAAAESLTKQDVSDVDTKKKKLARKPKTVPRKNYDDLMELVEKNEQISQTKNGPTFSSPTQLQSTLSVLQESASPENQVSQKPVYMKTREVPPSPETGKSENNIKTRSVPSTPQEFQTTFDNLTTQPVEIVDMPHDSNEQGTYIF